MATKTAQFHRAGVAILALCCAAALYPANPARATTLGYSFGGTVTYVQDAQSLDPPWNGVQVGDAWNITYIFDDATPDAYAPPVIGDYLGAISAFDLTIGPASVSSSATATYIRTYDGTLHQSGADMYEASIPFGSNYQYQWFMQLADSTHTAWGPGKADFAALGNPRDSMPNCLPTRQVLPIPGDLNWFDSRSFTMRQQGFPFGGEIGGSVDWHTDVPEPASAGLIALAALTLGKRRR
jgi:hypothetical protein